MNKLRGHIKNLVRDQWQIQSIKRDLISIRKISNPSEEVQIAAIENVGTFSSHNDDIRFRIEDNYTQEELLIIDLARANGTYLKAPNGEVSNLSPEQWAQVRTTAFKKWFGDWENNPDNASRIIDKNGEPMVVYHGSPNDFKIFDYGKIQTTRRAGFYFTRNIDLAKNYQKGGELIEAFVNLRKPLNSDETKKEITKELFVEIANEAGIERDMRRLYDIADSDIDLVSFLISANNDIKSVNDALYTVTKHDGIIMKGGGLGKSYVAFSPNQIKSAIENVGTFSLDNDDIRFRIVHHGGGTSFDKFSTEFIDTGEGNQSFGWGLYFTDEKDIAQYYEETIGKMPSYVLYKNGQRANMDDQISRIIYNFDGSVKKAIASNKKSLKYLEKEGDKELASEVRKIILELENEDPKAWKLKEEGNRYLYDVEIPDIGFLHWDKIVADEQKGQIIQQANKEGLSFSFYGDIVTPEEYFQKDQPEGFQVYKMLSKVLDGDKEVSMFLNRSGFNGIEYVAGRHSGSAKLPNSNFVVFDENAVRIIDHLRYRFIGEKGARKMNDAAGEINRDPDELIATINEYATELHHTSIRIIHNVEELPEDSTPYRLIKAGRDIKAYFDPKSKEVAVYLPNIQNTEDAKRSVYHEVVAHYGLREMYGVHFDNFLDNVFDNAMPVIQGKILYATQGDPSKLREATEEYLAKLAEHGFDSPEERTFWKKIQSAFIDMLRQANVSLNFKLTDDSLRCILYKSYLKLTQEVSNNNLNLSKMEEKTKETTQATEKIIPDEIKGVVLTKQQKDQLSKGKQVLLDNLIDRNGKPFSANVSYDFENNKPVYSFPEKQNQEFRMPNAIKGVELSEENKQQLTQGEKVFLEGMTSAKGALFDAYVYIDQEKKTLAFDFPEKPKQDQDFRMPNAIKGVELSEENKQRLTQGEKVFLEGMISAKGSLFDAYVYIDQEKKTLAFDFPEKPKQDQDFRMPNAIKGVELSEENKQRLTQGEKVFLEGMISAKGSLFDAYVYIDQEKKTLAFDFPEKKEKKKESVDSPQAEAIEKPKKKKLGL